MSPSPSFSSLQVLASDDTYGQEVELEEYPDEPQFALSYLTLPLLKQAIATYIKTDNLGSIQNLADTSNTKPLETNETENSNDYEKKTLNDNNQLTKSYESLNALNMEKKISSMETKNDPSFIISTIKSVFSSNEALNKSFLVSNSDL